MRRSSLFLLGTVGLMALLGLVLANASRRERAAAASLREKGLLVRRLGLTDLCLFTEASYTRHPTQAALFTPFQDHPLSLEHFPSGSLVRPFQIRKQAHGHLD